MSTSGDYWRESRAHKEREAKKWSYCPKCDKKEFHIAQRRCFGITAGVPCGYVEPRAQATHASAPPSP